MIQLSKATDYALLFLSNLSKQPKRRWSVRQAAQSLNLSQRFLANIVHQLGKAGIVTTFKGAGGGVQLVRDPETIPILDVVEVFEGKLTLVDCGDASVDCSHAGACGAFTFWTGMRREMIDRLSATTLKDFGGQL